MSPTIRAFAVHCMLACSQRCLGRVHVQAVGVKRIPPLSNDRVESAESGSRSRGLPRTGEHSGDGRFCSGAMEAPDVALRMLERLALRRLFVLSNLLAAASLLLDKNLSSKAVISLSPGTLSRVQLVGAGPYQGTADSTAATAEESGALAAHHLHAVSALGARLHTA